jgi:hypothetical protein
MRWRAGREVWAIGAALTFLASLAGTWMRAGIGSSVPSYRGWDLPFARWLLLLTGVAMLALSTLTLLPAASKMASRGLVIVGAIASFSTGLLLLGLEVVGRLIPSFVLPPTIRRLSVQTGGGLGLWLALGASATLIAAGTGSTMGLSASIWRSFDDRRAAVAAALGLLGTIAIARFRYLPWVAGSAGGHSAHIEGWALPWVGPFTLLGLWALGLSIVIWFARPTALPLLTAAAACWFVSFLSALTLITARTIARVRIEDRLPASVRNLSPAADPTWGPGACYAASLITVACVAYLLHRTDVGRDRELTAEEQ